MLSLRRLRRFGDTSNDGGLRRNCTRVSLFAKPKLRALVPLFIAPPAKDVLGNRQRPKIALQKRWAVFVEC